MTFTDITVITLSQVGHNSWKWHVYGRAYAQQLDGGPEANIADALLFALRSCDETEPPTDPLNAAPPQTPAPAKRRPRTARKH